MSAPSSSSALTDRWAAAKNQASTRPSISIVSSSDTVRNWPTTQYSGAISSPAPVLVARP